MLRARRAITDLMIELIILAVAFMLLAKRTPKRRRSMGKYLKGNVDERLDIGTLAGATLVLSTFDDAVVERMLVSSLKATWSLSDVTALENAGPLLVGIAHSDYTAAEIEEVIEAVGSWDEGNKITQERMRRQVRIVGQFSDQGALRTQVLNEGRPITTKLNWILTTGDTLDVWAYNLGTAAFSTTDPQIHVEGHVNLWAR